MKEHSAIPHTPSLCGVFAFRGLICKTENLVTYQFVHRIHFLLMTINSGKFTGIKIEIGLALQDPLESHRVR